MGREVWGTYAVGDHRRQRAFVADVLLFDRLAVPVPVDAQERNRWQGDGLAVDRLDEMLEVLGPRAHHLPWHRYESGWRKRHEEIRHLAGDLDPRTFALGVEAAYIAAELPTEVTGVDAVTTYPTVAGLVRDLGLGKSESAYSRSVAVLIGREFLVPDDSQMPELRLLEAAVDLSGQRDFDRKRRAYWRWYRDLTGGVVPTQQGLQDAIEEMRDLVEDEKEAARRAGVKTKVRYAFTLASAILSVAATPLAPIALGGAFLSIGHLGTSEFLERRHSPTDPSPAALVYAGRKSLGWA